MIEQALIPKIDARISKIISRYDEIAVLISSPEIDQKEYVKMSKEYSDLSEVVEVARQIITVKSDIDGIKQILSDESSDDDIKQMALEEMPSKEVLLSELYEKIIVFLIPKEGEDERNALLEIRAGTGGDEAALFGSVLLKMYQKYSENVGWKFELLSISNNDIGGIKEVIVSIKGRNVFEKLKYESGVHRVQRIPETEANGRIHTSAATVVVMAEVEEVDIKLEEKDIRVDVFCASGPGGQHVNKTESAVRLTHIPTGTVVSMQDEKSQHKNKERAMKILLARVYEEEKRKRNEKLSNERKSQIGSGDRSERIRTYNYPQGRVTDHRINLTLYKIVEITEEGRLDYVVNELLKIDAVSKIENL